MFTQAEENYLKAIYALENESSESISTNNIALKMETKASSVTDMLKKLAAKKLVEYKPYKGVHLTFEGEKVALKVIRKHRLWEYFLVKKLKFSWDSVHEIAEQLEHIQSDDLVNSLDAFLGFPKKDPHGDPIPDKDGIVVSNTSINMLGMKVGDVGVLNGVKDSTDAFLRYLDKKNLALGDRIKIIDIEPYDNSVYIETKTHHMSISKHVAKNLYLKNKK